MNNGGPNELPVRKIILAGSGAVGKTSIATRLITGSFIEQKMTTGLNIETWTVEDASEKAAIKIVSFDLGGQEQFRFFQQELIKGANFAVIVFDLSRYESFLELEDWMKFLEHIPEECRVLVANKVDASPVVNEEDIQEFARRYNIPVVRTSCVTGEGIENLERVVWESLKGSGICANNEVISG